MLRTQAVINCWSMFLLLQVFNVKRHQMEITTATEMRCAIRSRRATTTHRTTNTVRENESLVKRLAVNNWLRFAGRFDASALHIAHALKQTEIQKSYNKAREKPIDEYLVSFFFALLPRRSSITFWAGSFTWKLHFLVTLRVQVQDSLRSIAIQQNAFMALSLYHFRRGSKQQREKMCENNRHLNFTRNAQKSWENNRMEF